MVPRRREPGGGRRGRPREAAAGEAGAGPRRGRRVRGPRRHLLRLLPPPLLLLLVLPAGVHGQPGLGPHAPDWPPSGPGPSLSIYLSEEEVRQLIGECAPGPGGGAGLSGGSPAAQEELRGVLRASVEV